MSWKFISTAVNAWKYVSTAVNDWKYTSAETELNYCSDYLIVYEAMTNKPPPAIAEEQNTFVESLISAGVWDVLDCLFVFAQYSNSDSEALINWVTPGTNNATLINSPTFTSLEGFRGNATDNGVDTNFNPANGVNYLQDDASIGAYIRTLGGANSLCHWGVKQGRYTQLHGNYSLINSAYAYNDNTPPAYTGLISLDRSESSKGLMYRNGVYVMDLNEVSAALPDGNIHIHNKNMEGAAPQYYTDSQISTFYAGASLTANQHLNLFAAIETYLAAI